MKTIKRKMYRLGHICRGIINVGLRKNIKIKGGVVKKPISCRYAFPTIPLEDIRFCNVSTRLFPLEQGPTDVKSKEL